MKKMKRLLSYFCVVMIIFSMFSLCTVSAGAAQNATLEAIKKAFPDNSYWNGNFDNAKQCHGWALKAAYTAYGEHAKYDWKKSYRPSNPSLKPGDIVSYYRSSAKSGKKTHTVLITAVNGNTLTLAECNYQASNTVRYGRTINKSFNDNKSAFGIEYVWSAPYALDSASYITIGEIRKVTTSSGLNIRSGIGTSYSKVGTIPKGKTFTVTTYPISKNGYTWQYTETPYGSGYVVTNKWSSYISGSIYPQGEFKLSPKCAPNSSITVSGKSKNNEAILHLWENHKDESCGCMTWSFEPVSYDSSTGRIHYVIKNKRSGRVIDINANNGSIQQYDVNYGHNQRFSLVPVGDGYYRIESLWLGHSLDIYKGYNTNGTEVIYYYNDDYDEAQLFRLVQ